MVEPELRGLVDVQRRDADVIAFGLIFDDDSLLPVGSLIPQHAVFRDGDDVLLAVAIDIRQRHGIADFSDVRIERPGFKFRKLRSAGYEAHQPQCRTGHCHCQLLSHACASSGNRNETVRERPEASQPATP